MSTTVAILPTAPVYCKSSGPRPGKPPGVLLAADRLGILRLAFQDHASGRI